MIDDSATAGPQTVLILGMHRSGTSCLAGSLQEAGGLGSASDCGYRFFKNSLLSKLYINLLISISTSGMRQTPSLKMIILLFFNRLCVFDWLRPHEFVADHGLRIKSRIRQVGRRKRGSGKMGGSQTLDLL